VEVGPAFIIPFSDCLARVIRTQYATCAAVGVCMCDGAVSAGVFWVQGSSGPSGGLPWFRFLGCLSAAPGTRVDEYPV